VFKNGVSLGGGRRTRGEGHEEAVVVCTGNRKKSAGKKRPAEVDIWVGLSVAGGFIAVTDSVTHGERKSKI